MVSLTGQLITAFQRLNLGWTIQARSFAARKATRERKAKYAKAMKAKKLAKLAQMQAMITTKDRLKTLANKKNVVVPEYVKYPEYKLEPPPSDNVYITSTYQWRTYSFEEAVMNHRELCDPSMYDKPNALLQLYCELDMQGTKKTKTVKKFTRTIAPPNLFDHQEEKNIAVFCNPEDMESAKKGNPDAIFGPIHIKEILRGEIPLYNYNVFIAHPSILPQLMVLKSILKTNYPNAKDGSLSPHLAETIQLHKVGYKYSVNPYNEFPEYGQGTIKFGTLNMDIDKLEENCVAVINDVNSMRPKRAGPFILRLQVTCSGNPEKFKLDVNKYITDESKTEKQSIKKVEEEEEDEENSAVISAV